MRTPAVRAVGRMAMKLADYIIARAMRTPYRHLPGYMERFWLLPYSRLPVAVRVHHILRSDDDRAFHDHPWPYLTVILRGGYTEVRPVFDRSGLYAGTTSAWRAAGSVLFRGARSWHRLEVPAGVDTWTLFITGPKVQQWGFMVHPDRKMPWRKFLNDFTSEGTPGT